MITNSNLLIYGFLQNGQPVYITAPSSVTGTQIQLSPINYPTLNHLPDLSPMRMNNRFPESWANDPDFPPLPQMEDCNENLSAINPFAAEGIITNKRTTNTNEKIAIFQNLLIKAGKEATHIRRDGKHHKVTIWWNKECSIAKYNLDTAKRLYKRYRTYELYVEMQRNNARLKKTIVTAKKDSWIKFLDGLDFRTPVTKTYTTIKKLLSRDSQETINPPLVYKNRFLISDIDKANAAAEHLASIVSVEDPFVEEAIAQKSKVKRMSQIDNNIPYNSPFSLHELTTVIKSLPKTSPGDDGIYPHFIQNLPIDWVQILLGIINETWDHGLFPKSWKDGTVKLIPKQGKDKSKIENYRTITLLPVAGKIYERLVKQRLTTMIEINKGLQDIQYGFRKGRNTDDIMFRFLNDALYALENKKVLVAVFLDVKAAFETMVHRQILDGVLEAKIRGRLFAFSLSFLEDRDMKKISMTEKDHPLKSCLLKHGQLWLSTNKNNGWSAGINALREKGIEPKLSETLHTRDLIPTPIWDYQSIEFFEDLELWEGLDLANSFKYLTEIWLSNQLALPTDVRYDTLRCKKNDFLEIRNSVSTMAFSMKVPCFAKPRSSLDVPKELLIDSVPPSEIVIGGGRACEVSVGHFGGQKVALKKYIGIRGNAKYESVILKEAAAIYKTRHENVVGIRFVCLKEMTLGLEYCEKVLTDEDGNPHSFNNARQILGFLSVLSSEFPFEKDGFHVDVIVNKIMTGVLPCHEDMSSPLKEVFLKCCAFEPKARPTVFELCKMLTELAPEAFMQPDRALNSTIQFPILNSNNDSYQENFSVSDLPLTDLSQPVSHTEFSSSCLPDSHLLVSEVMVPATEPSQMILDAVAGCALRNFGITQLKDFQIRSITNILKKEDALVVSGTGSGKSICYQIPSVMESGITLLVVRTIALRKDQNDFLLSRGIDSFVVGEKIAPVEYDQQVTAISDLSENKPVILVGTPESFMGREGSLGFVRRQRSLLDRRLKFVVFDECHLLYDWCGFRSSFLELKSLRSFFPRTTFLALTATLLPKDEKLIIEEFLHNPCVVRMSVDRPNVRLEISHYSPPSGLEGSVDWVESWSEAAKRIIGTVNGQLAIVYFSYAREANAACSAISSLGVKAAAFTGECSSLDKNHIHAAMRNGEIEILCATTAYGCHLNLPDVRCVVRFGLPKNMSSWMQEQGRAGRD
ncbi:hypothetical protein QYM36_015238 [Artemia franciscana]|uniref:DNA 3'-5' helicase n=1 Tax=Artemia franciscana TaxID=6661 RepID=A0AA88H8S5_ARTSF|nr:hypothetical protein QYM36_015238 [Artemia franciscana]